MNARVSCRLILGMLVLTPGLVLAQVDRSSSGVQREAVIGGHRLELRAFAWRDFMPSLGRTGGSGLMVNLLVIATDSLPFPTGLRIDSAWVRTGTEVWATAPTDEPRPEAHRTLDQMLRGGPRWRTGAPVDILIRIRLRSGATGYLEVRGAPIGRTS